MPDVELKPLSQVDLGLMTRFMDDEEQAWLHELDWDYSPIRRILRSFLDERMLPGFFAGNGGKISGYTYFLIARGKGMVGTVYANPPNAQTTADQVLSCAIENLKSLRGLRRIEAQIIPLGSLALTPVFSRHGFCCFLRHYMELDLTAELQPPADHPAEIVPWSSRHLKPAAAVAFRSYKDGIDAAICEDYLTEATCEGYLRSLSENPGCGIFLPDCSFVGLDRGGIPRGFILTSRLSRTAAMIPQIAIHPSFQSRGLGTALMRLALHRLAGAGFMTARLTVTHDNKRAYQWYTRLGFRMRRDFDAYVWQRQ